MAVVGILMKLEPMLSNDSADVGRFLPYTRQTVWGQGQILWDLLILDRLNSWKTALAEFCR